MKRPSSMKRHLAIALALVLILAACGDDEPAGDGGDTTTTALPSFDGSWLLISGTLDDAPITIVDGYPITLVLDGAAAGGTAACNSYGGEATIEDDTIEFGPMAITEMACGDGGVMDSESEFMEALARTDTIKIVDGMLELAGDGVALTFGLEPPVPTAELTGTVWVLDSLLTRDAVSSVMGERATLELFTDGSVLGSTGCRTLSGEYVVSGASVEITQFSADGDCDPQLAHQDDHVISVLGDGFTVEVEGDRLTVMSAGNEGLIYKADG